MPVTYCIGFLHSHNEVFYLYLAMLQRQLEANKRNAGRALIGYEKEQQDFRTW
jgi:hypothetical protein